VAVRFDTVRNISIPKSKAGTSVTC